MNKWLSRVNQSNLKNHKSSGDNVDIANSNLSLSTMAPLTPRILNKKSYIDVCKINELRNIIKKVSEYYGGDEDCFFEEYINDILMKNEVDTVLTCFRNLAAQIPPANNRK